MSIELTCHRCGSVLRVDAKHAGKQLRCPTCSEIISIPSTSTFGSSDVSGEPFEDPYHQDDQPYVSSSASQSDWEPVDDEIPRSATVNSHSGEPFYTAPYAGPRSAPMHPDQVWPASGATHPNPVYDHVSETELGRSYLFFGLGILSYILCGCLGVIIGPIMFGNGMARANQSRLPARTTAYVLNLIGFCISLLVVLGSLSVAFFG